MGSKENNKLIGYQCKCASGTDCGEEYYLGDPPQESCKNPKCDVAQYNVVDSWSSDVSIQYLGRIG